MLRFLVLLFLPSTVLSQCTTCTQQSGYIGIYGSSGSMNSAQYSSGQYICTSCQSSSSFQSGYQYNPSQFQCNSCQYSPGVQATTTMSPSYTMAQCTCNNCQQQGIQYSCNTCQTNVGLSGYGYSSPVVNQQFNDPGQYGSQQNYDYSTTLSPYGSQQYQNPSMYSSSSYSQQPYSNQFNNEYSTTMAPYSNPQYNPSQQGFSTTSSPYMNQQYQTAGMYGSTGQFGVSTTFSPLGNQQFNDQNMNGGSPTRYYNELTNTNLGFPPGYSSGAPGTQPLFDQSSTNQNNDGTYVSGQYLPGVQGRVYDSRVGLTQFNTQVKK